jgi:hypothetical protein
MSDYSYEPTRNEQIIVTNSSSVILPANTSQNDKRKSFVLRNTSTVAAERITIHLGSGQAVDKQGIVLLPNETYYEATDLALECWQGDITAICSNASAIANLSVFMR